MEPIVIWDFVQSSSSELMVQMMVSSKLSMTLFPNCFYLMLERFLKVG